MTKDKSKDKKVIAPQSESKDMGRPKLNLDEDIIANLAAIGSTQIEIASVMGVSAKTLQRHYAQLIKDSQNKGNTSLRRAMYKNALEKNNPNMMIWLSKNALGMAEKTVTEDITNKPLPLIINEKDLTIVTDEEE